MEMGFHRCETNGIVHCFAAAMYAHQVPDAQYPKETAIGRDQQGAFCTARRNIQLGFRMPLQLLYVNRLYKHDLNQRRLVSFVPIAPANLEWITEAARTGAAIRTGRDFLPDCQGA